MQLLAISRNGPCTRRELPRYRSSRRDRAARRFLEFFAANPSATKIPVAYYRVAARFFAWCDHHKIGEITDIEPLHVAAYVEALGKDFEKPTVKQHLAAIRMLFDWLVTARVPKKYHEYIGTHAADPGTGKGRQAVKMRAELEAAE